MCSNNQRRSPLLHHGGLITVITFNKRVAFFLLYMFSLAKSTRQRKMLIHIFFAFHSANFAPSVTSKLKKKLVFNVLSMAY